MKKAAFFDIDGTLVTCQTQRVLATIMRKEGLLTAFQTGRIFSWFLIYKFGFSSQSVEIRKRVYKTLSFRPKGSIDQLFAKAANEIIRSHLRLWMKLYVARHQQKGDLIFALSGSLLDLCQPVCGEFEIEHCFATRLRAADGRYTGAWEGDILEGEKKVKLMRALSEKYGIDLSSSSAYADSYSDLPMLNVVGHPVAICPDRRLERHAIRRAWRILKEPF